MQTLVNIVSHLGLGNIAAFVLVVKEIFGIVRARIEMRHKGKEIEAQVVVADAAAETAAVNREHFDRMDDAQRIQLLWERLDKMDAAHEGLKAAHGKLKADCEEREANLARKHDAEILDLKKRHTAEIEALELRQSEERDALDKRYRQQIAALEKKHDSDITELRQQIKAGQA